MILILKRRASASTQKEVEEVGCSLDGESEMIVDDNATNDNERKIKIRDGCQFSVKMKKLPLRDCSQTVDSDVEVDSDSLAFLQSLSLPKSGYSMLSIKNFLKNTKGARNLKIECFLIYNFSSIPLRIFKNVLKVKERKVSLIKRFIV